MKRGRARVEIANPIVDIVHMQVCAANDATDEEILDVCNRENRAGTEMGWAVVHREAGDLEQGPVACADDPGRTHFLVSY